MKICHCMLKMLRLAVSFPMLAVTDVKNCIATFEKHENQVHHTWSILWCAKVMTVNTDMCFDAMSSPLKQSARIKSHGWLSACVFWMRLHCSVYKNWPVMMMRATAPFEKTKNPGCHRSRAKILSVQHHSLLRALRRSALSRPILWKRQSAREFFLCWWLAYQIFEAAAGEKCRRAQ